MYDYACACAIDSWNDVEIAGSSLYSVWQSYHNTNKKSPRLQCYYTLYKRSSICRTKSGTPMFFQKNAFYDWSAVIGNRLRLQLYSTLYRPTVRIWAQKWHACRCGRGSATDSAEFWTSLHGEVEKGRKRPGREGREPVLAWPTPHKILD